MQFPSRQSIRFKLIAIAAATSALSLLVASAGFPYFDLANYRDRVTLDLGQQADLVASASASGLALKDRSAVTEALQTLNHQTDVRSAAVYDEAGARQAALVHGTATPPVEQQDFHGDATLVSGDTIFLVRSIHSGPRLVGYVTIRSDFSGWYARRNKYLAIVGALLLSCVGIALLLGGRLQRIISKPIQNLLNTMQTVTAEKRFDLRASKRADDEIGQLVDAFNAMLAEIEVRDRTVRVMNDMLEERVKSRTIQLEQEIADRNAAQEELLRSQIVLNDFFENATIGLTFLEANGTIGRANRAELDLLGYTPEEYVGHSACDFHAEREPLLEMLKQLQSGEPFAAIDARLRCKDGSYKHVAIEANALWEGNRFIHARCFTRDLSAQQEAERAREHVVKAERANLAKSEFLSRMSHELRTPMNSILGFSQLLELEDLTDDQTDSVKQIISAGKHLLRLINEVLDISRIESGNLSVSNESVNVIEAITDTVGIVQPLANARKIVVNFPKNAPPTFALADEQRLRQVLLNLLSNAIKYNCEGGSVNVSIEAHEDRLRIDVKDTGPGIDSEKASLLFLPFQRLGAEATEVEGTGLGLALSLRLSEAMGGTLGLEECASGAHFYLDLRTAENPLKLLEASSALRPPSFLSGVSDDLKLDILLVEDNPANIRLLEKILSNRPETRLRTVGTGWQAIQAARAERPDLVLLDLNLPDMSGFDVVLALRNEATTKNLPIIITSADATDGQVERLLAAGANEYLTKPIDIQALFVSINRCLTQTVKQVA